MRYKFWVVGLLMVSMSGSLWADPCDKDRVTVCNDASAGDGRVYDCLVGRRDKITPECGVAIDRASQLAAAVTFSCKPEVQRWCAQYTGDGRTAVIECLKRHKDVVGEECKHKYRQFMAFGFDVKS